MTPPPHARRRISRALFALALTLAPAAACRSRNGESPARQSSLVPASTRANAAQGAVGGGEQPGAEHVTVGAFCDRLGAVFCQHCAPSTADCLQSFMNGCLEGHGRETPTAHTQADLQSCAREMMNGDCARMMAAGELPPACQ